MLPWPLASSFLLPAHLVSPPNVSHAGGGQRVNGLRKDGQLEQKEGKEGVKVYTSDREVYEIVEEEGRISFR